MGGGYEWLVEDNPAGCMEQQGQLLPRVLWYNICTFFSIVWF
jgi:hypothetical protein